MEREWKPLQTGPSKFSSLVFFQPHHIWNFLNNNPHLFFFLTIFRFDGDYKKGKWDGRGTYTQADGSVYKGSFKKGELSGKGKYKWADGDVYDGEWKDSKMHGKGKFTWKDGKTYEGDFVRGKFEHNLNHIFSNFVSSISNQI